MRRSFCLILLLLGGCATDPMDRPGTWNASRMQANDANLRAMVADPRDLIQGRDAGPGSLAAEAGSPVRRLLSGRRYPLPQTNTSQIPIASSQPEQSQPQGGGNGSY